MAIEYAKTSPYYNTNTHGFFLDVTQFRKIPKDTSDVTFKINQTYKHRPDLLASDLYGDSRLWWVFAQRNPNTIKDPVFDFTPGTTIFIPKKDTVFAALGL